MPANESHRNDLAKVGGQMSRETSEAQGKSQEEKTGRKADNRNLEQKLATAVC